MYTKTELKLAAKSLRPLILTIIFVTVMLTMVFVLPQPWGFVVAGLMIAGVAAWGILDMEITKIRTMRELEVNERNKEIKEDEERKVVQFKKPDLSKYGGFEI